MPFPSSLPRNSRIIRRALRPNDGLGRESSSFNQLEVRVCTVCAPGDQTKSSGSQREHAELNALQCQWWTDVELSFIRSVHPARNRGRRLATKAVIPSCASSE